MIDESKILGVILAGGKGTRMGGEEKGLIRLNNKSLIEYSIERLKPQVNNLVINANNNLKKYSRFNMPIVPDSLSGFLGPLAGVLAGLDYADQKGYTHIEGYYVTKREDKAHIRAKLHIGHKDIPL